MRLPAARLREMHEDGSEERNRWCGVRVHDGLAEVVKGGVPLVGLFVEEEWNSVGRLRVYVYENE